MSLKERGHRCPQRAGAAAAGARRKGAPPQTVSAVCGGPGSSAPYEIKTSCPFATAFSTCVLRRAPPCSTILSQEGGGPTARTTTTGSAPCCRRPPQNNNTQQGGQRARTTTSSTPGIRSMMSALHPALQTPKNTCAAHQGNTTHRAPHTGAEREEWAAAGPPPRSRLPPLRLAASSDSFILASAASTSCGAPGGIRGGRTGSVRRRRARKRGVPRTAGGKG